jgi:hypothetical protein
MNNKIASSAHHNTTSKGSIKQHFHFNLAFTDPSAYVDRGESGGGDAEHCVDNCAVLGHADTQDTIERGPEHEQENTTNHGGNLLLVSSFHLFTFVLYSSFRFEEESGSETKVCTEHVNSHCTADIVHVKHFENDHSVQREEHRLEGGNQHQLGESCLTKERSHRNEERTSAELSLSQLQNGNVDVFMEAMDKHFGPEALEQDAALHSPTSAQEVEAD